MKKTIAILFHERDRERGVMHYAIDYIAQYWRDEGHKVFHLFGTKTFEPADAVIVHVNLSVVPDAYLEFARRYPVALNGEVKDIRKSTFSSNLLTERDTYNKPVIVKSNLNYAGRPERVLGRRWLPEKSRFARRVSRLWTRVNPHAVRFEEQENYPVYDRLSDVPRRYFRSKDVIVEKFLPEVEGELYAVRYLHFLGDRTVGVRYLAKIPVVNGQTQIDKHDVEPHPGILEIRNNMNMDYGKLDYVIHDGRLVLLDVNKTIGAATISTDEVEEKRRHLAGGLSAYFDRQARGSAAPGSSIP